ncbi:MAG TPA: sigma-70 family RNA polymerase sigma factor, partial [Acidimicrobiales bacterium]|nr:sigma-70 family RNA polymerase sigma factor [Acidimicrobiales bacterium]
MSRPPATNTVAAEQLEQYRHELTGYCYRMLGSIHEAEDAVQDTMLRAWRALDRFEDREGLRPWLYRIATNVCIDMSKGRARRALPMDVAPVQSGQLVRGDVRPEAFWIGPAPDRLVLSDGDPAEHALSRESVRIAFIAALQHLAPRQRAVLILRDVLRWRAAEVAVLLETSTAAVNSALRRAREAVGDVDRDRTPSEPSPDDREVLAAYIDAFEREDVDGLVALLRDDAILEMPPFELWMRGPADIRRWMVAADAFGQEKFTAVSANGSPAVAVYRPHERGGRPQAFAIQVLDVVEGRIGAIHVFLDPALFELFGLPLEPAA